MANQTRYVLIVTIAFAIIAVAVVIRGAGSSANATPPSQPASEVRSQMTFLYVFPTSGQRSAEDVLQAHLANGWTIAKVSPLGGSDGATFTALIVLERIAPSAATKGESGGLGSAQPAPQDPTRTL